MDDHDTVGGDVDVELHRISTELDGAREGREGILRVLAWSASVSDALDAGSGGEVRHGAYIHRRARQSEAPKISIQSLNKGEIVGVYQADRMTNASRGGDGESDLDLIARWRRGDQRAATELVGRHAQALARFAGSFGANDDVDDLVQDTFVRAFQSLDGFRGDSSFRTWLFTIERRLLLDRRRAARRRPSGVEVQETDAATEYDALDSIVAGEAATKVQQALKELSPTQREVFTLRVAEGLSYREIAEIVGTTEGAARVHYHNAVRTVKEFIDD